MSVLYCIILQNVVTLPTELWNKKFPNHIKYHRSIEYDMCIKMFLSIIGQKVSKGSRYILEINKM